MMTAIAKLAEFASMLDVGRVPAEARHAGRRILLNAVALAVGAAHHPAVELVVGLGHELGGTGSVSLLGRPERASLSSAALVTGTAAHAEDFDDTHLPTVLHPGAPIVPAALTVGEHTGATGADVLAGVIAGTEVAIRVGNGVCPEHFDQGWHVTSSCGRIGAAVAAARVLGLDPQRTATALAIAATEVGGLTAALGTMVKPLHAGKAAADGIEAALLAAEGFTASPWSLEGRRGFGAVASRRADYDAMVAGLGQQWEITAVALKPYACGIVSHAVIDAGVQLGSKLAPDDVDEVHVRVNPVVLDVMGVQTPVDGLESKFSVYHCFTVGFLDGAGGLVQFSDERAHAADVVALRDRVRVSTDVAVPKGAAQVRVRTADGAHVEHEVRHATASAENPMTDEQLRTKALSLASPILGEQAEALVQRCLDLDTGGDLEALLAAATPGGRRA